MSYKPGFKLSGETDLCTNAQAFATYQEAHDSAHARFLVWTIPSDFGVVESDEPVNYVRLNGRDEMVKQEPVHETQRSTETEHDLRAG